MMDFVATFQHWLTLACFVALAVCLFALAVLCAIPELTDAIRRFCGMDNFGKVVCGVCIVGAVLYGGSKGVNVRWDDGLADNGTLITNDTVSVRWTYSGIPSASSVFIDYREAGTTNDWLNLAETLASAQEWTGTLANATNYDYWVYSTYVPPVPVHTNGVWVGQAYETKARVGAKSFLILNGMVQEHGRTIATPAAKRRDAVPTARDYIQDGLIAMWDGIERGDNPLVWSDITGNGWDLTVTSGSEWLTDALSCSDYQRFGIASMPNRLIPAASVEHVEITCFVTKRQNDPLIFYNGSSELKGAKNIVITASTAGVETSENKVHTACKLTTGLFRISATWEKLYIDGERVTDTIFTRDKWSGGSESFALFGRSNDSNYAAAGRVYCVRIYNRELTTEEIEHNYKIDKERFNLP